jgi:hypothetical protein
MTIANGSMIRVRLRTETKDVMPTAPFHKHPSRPLLDVALWAGFLIAAILAILAILGTAGC